MPKCQRKATDSTDNRKDGWEKPQEIVSAQPNCSNRWLTGLVQPTFSPQENRKVIWATDPAQLINLSNILAQNSGTPLVPLKMGTASQGQMVHELHAYKLAPNQALLLPQLSTCTAQCSCWIFSLQTSKQSQALRYNLNLSQAQSRPTGYTCKKRSWERCVPFHKDCDLLWPWKFLETKDLTSKSYFKQERLWIAIRWWKQEGFIITEPSSLQKENTFWYR